MGVKGLTSFLDSNSQFLTDFKLRDTKVIIDGNNLFHFLNDLYHVDNNYGGDYDCFALATTGFFSTLMKCNVTPVVLFDGPYIPSEKKIGTSIRRAKERILLAYHMTLGLPGRATPIFCLDVFISCLDAMSVKHVTCDGEADGEIAELANLYRCPVMTNDSDFFIFDIKAGVILLDYVNLRIREDKSPSMPEESTCYIDVQLYLNHKLIDFFKLDADRLALFGTMLGNDKVDVKRFQPFLMSERLPDVGARGNKIFRILHWLGEMENLDNAIKKILNHYTRDMKVEMEQVIMESIESYRSTGISHVQVPDDLFTKHAENVLLSFAGHPPPEWFMVEMHKGRISTLASNTLTSRKVILLAQPENFALRSAYDCSKHLRRIIYGIILQHDIKFHSSHSASSTHCSDNCASAANPKKLVVEEVDRDRRCQRQTVIDPVFTVNGKELPSLAEVHGIAHSEKLSHLCLAFGIIPDNAILRYCPMNLQLYLVSITYWINHAEPKVDILHLTTVLLCILKLSAVDHLAGLKQMDDTEQSPECDVNISEDDPELVCKMLSSCNLRDFIKAHCSCAKISSARIFLDKFMHLKEKMTAKSRSLAIVCDVDVLHVFAQLQACMQAAQALNELLGSPLVRIPISEVYCGTFLFYFYREIQSRKKRDSYVYEALGKCSVMSTVVKVIRKWVLDTVKDGVVVTDVMPSRRQSKKKKGKARVIHIEDELDDGDDDDDDNKIKLVAKCDLDNRFECLMQELPEL